MLDRPIRVGLTERHGMAAEQIEFGPPAVQYTFLAPINSGSRLFRSPIKGFMRGYAADGVDLIEAVLSPIITDRPWIYSCESLAAAAAFNLLHVPIPRSVRVAYIRHLLMRENCKKVVLWSHAGYRTFSSYGRLHENDPVRQKVTVIWPAVRRVPDQQVHQSRSGVRMLFTGDFFRKGGVNVVDAFERARRRYPTLTLDVCCDERFDFNTPDAELRSTYLAKLKSTPGITARGRVTRQELFEHLLPATDVYLLPTYAETFGMSILEAMAFGIPVIATNCFAIPEIIVDGESGLLIDISAFDVETMFRGYVVRQLPHDFREHVTNRLFENICRLIESPELRRQIGSAALERARTVFSFDQRNAQMLRVYREACA